MCVVVRQFNHGHDGRRLGVTEIRIPKLGMATVEVDVVKWYVRVGDVVERGTPLAELESEKTAMVVESDISGLVVEILTPEGTIANVGDVLCTIRKDEKTP